MLNSIPMGYAKVTWLLLWKIVWIGYIATMVSCILHPKNKFGSMGNYSYICIEVEGDKWEAMQDLMKDMSMASPQITEAMVDRVIADLERKEKINLVISKRFRIFGIL
jgi:hypothetical protein